MTMQDTDFSMRVTPASGDAADATPPASMETAAQFIAELSSVLVLSIQAFQEGVREHATDKAPQMSEDVKNVWSWMKDWSKGTTERTSMDIGMFLRVGFCASALVLMKP